MDKLNKREKKHNQKTVGQPAAATRKTLGQQALSQVRGRKRVGLSFKRGGKEMSNEIFERYSTMS